MSGAGAGGVDADMTAGRTVIIAQARMSSTRLPGKAMADLGGRPVIDRVLERCVRAELADDLWVAITTDPGDDVLAEHLEAQGYPVVRGSLEDVLSRYAFAAAAAEADTIVRVTCDCPLIDPETIDRVILGFRSEPAVDYCSNTLRRTYPLGMDTEVFSHEALERAHAEAREAPEREHVTPYLYQHPELFSLRNVEAPEWATEPDVRLTVDEAADLELLRELVRRLGPDPSLRAVLAEIERDAALAAINASVAHRHTDKPATW